MTLDRFEFWICVLLAWVVTDFVSTLLGWRDPR